MTAARLARVHGTAELDALFPDGALTTPVPWGCGAPLGRRPVSEQVAVRSVVASRPHARLFRELDPARLQASQSSLIRAGVAYYLGDEYRRTGRTYADQLQAANKYPVVHLRGDDAIVLSGHHRAAAALLIGEPLLARVVVVDEVDDDDGGVAVTPSLFFGGHPPRVEHAPCDEAWKAEVWINLGSTAWIATTTHHAIRHLGYELGIAPTWMRHQLHFARTGQIRGLDAEWSIRHGRA